METFLIRSILLLYTILKRTAMLRGHPSPLYIIYNVRDRIKYI